MSDQKSLENRLGELAEYCDAGPCLVSRVMDEIGREMTIAERSASRKRLRRRIMRATVRYGLAIVTLLVIVVAFWLRPAEFGAGFAFADVQQALGRIETAIVEIDYPKAPHKNLRMVIGRASGRLRVEWPTGLAYVIDGAQRKCLALDPKQRTAYVTPYPDDLVASEILSQLASVEQEAVEPLGKRVFGEHTLTGFLLERGDELDGRAELRVWVDSNTRLPMRMEQVPVDSDNPQSSRLHFVAKLTINKPLDESLLSLTPPEGFRLVSDVIFEGTASIPLPPAPKNNDLASPVVDPTVGIGQARFGMTVEQVIEVLGQPDEMLECHRISAEAERAVVELSKKLEEEGLSDAERERLKQELQEKYHVQVDRAHDDDGGTLRTWGGDLPGVLLGYDGRGFQLTIWDDKGLCEITCSSGEPGKRDFSGRTSRGAAMGATAEQIEGAYGQADEKTERPKGVVSLHYKSPDMSFTLRDDRLVTMSFSHE